MDFFQFIINVLSWTSIVAGSILMIVGALGMLRFKEFWARLHAASIIESGGMIFLIFGMMLQSNDWLVFFKLAFIGFFLFITGPTATHALARAALSEQSIKDSTESTI